MPGLGFRGRPSEEVPLKVLHCPCGTNVSGETEDELVKNVEEHISASHQELVGKYSRQEILEMAHEH
jgi:predicted small metal-binding protein